VLPLKPIRDAHDDPQLKQLHHVEIAWISILYQQSEHEQKIKNRSRMRNG
jgi:hypothetical protein